VVGKAELTCIHPLIQLPRLRDAANHPQLIPRPLAPEYEFTST
jgi:hypothetical protein